MTMKEWLDRELATVRAQKQNALNIYQQACGAEQALAATLEQVAQEKLEAIEAEYQASLAAQAAQTAQTAAAIESFAAQEELNRHMREAFPLDAPAQEANQEPNE